jgi:hypothetical protein
MSDVFGFQRKTRVITVAPGEGEWQVFLDLSTVDPHMIGDYQQIA